MARLRWTALGLLLVGLAASGIEARATSLRRDVVYGHAEGAPLLLDVRIPAGPGPGPFPMAILVHGGGWAHGDKAGSDHPGDGADITPWFEPLAAAGFVSFSIEYRRAPSHHWPAGFEDLKTAIKWAKAHAREFHGDPTRIVLIGHSAGGQMVCLAGSQLVGEDRVQAVVGCAAVSDLEFSVPGHPNLPASIQQRLWELPPKVTPETQRMLQAASPADQVHAGQPPTLLIQGDLDRTVPVAESVQYQARLRAAGDRCELIVIPKGLHGPLSWGPLEPRWTHRMVEWLEQAVATPAGTP